jgi:hypothetical protein
LLSPLEELLEELPEEPLPPVRLVAVLPNVLTTPALDANLGPRTFKAALDKNELKKDKATAVAITAMAAIARPIVQEAFIPPVYFNAESLLNKNAGLAISTNVEIAVRIAASQPQKPPAFTAAEITNTAIVVAIKAVKIWLQICVLTSLKVSISA